VNPIETILGLLRTAGQGKYGETDVTQLEHALQCATLAEQAGAAPALVAAALLHDIGHLANPEDYPALLRDEDGRHEDTGAALLAQWFGPEVSEPVRLHVPAKRYLAAAEPGYAALLSEASVTSLRLQGGPFDADEARAFLALPDAADAIRLRRWDDRAKVAGAPTPDLDHFVNALRGSLVVGRD
jgi:gamma-butyrobetaine dioxygenase